VTVCIFTGQIILSNHHWQIYFIAKILLFPLRCDFLLSWFWYQNSHTFVETHVGINYNRQWKYLNSWLRCHCKWELPTFLWFKQFKLAYVLRLNTNRDCVSDGVLIAKKRSRKIHTNHKQRTIFYITKLFLCVLDDHCYACLFCVQWVFMVPGHFFCVPSWWFRILDVLHFDKEAIFLQCVVWNSEFESALCLLFS
jgi:hypothetical protein